MSDRSSAALARARITELLGSAASLPVSIGDETGGGIQGQNLCRKMSPRLPVRFGGSLIPGEEARLREES